jgi:predicted dehydrogenase
MNRRQLLKSAGLAAAVAQTAGSSQIARAAASDRIGVGLIGCGNQGTADERTFVAQPDVDVVAVCDVYEPNMQNGLKTAGGKAKTYRDYRKLLEDKNVQAVIIGTPEHWHALMTIDACNAGKDVYVEKPAAHYIREGRLAVEAARRNNRIVQVGSQQRSGSHFQRAVEYVQNGRLGDIHYATCWGHSASPEGSGRAASAPVAAPPADLDFDLYLGPAAQRPVGEIWPGGRSRYWDFSGGYVCEWGAHLADIVLWGMKARSPSRVFSMGAQFRSKSGEIPDTLEVLCEYPNFIMQFSVLSHSSWGPNGDPGIGRYGSYGIQFQGTKGTLFVDRSGFRLTPQFIRREDPKHGPKPFAQRNEIGFYYDTAGNPEYSDTSSQGGPHVRNFLDCVKSRQRPIADIEEGHYTNTVCRLANISYRLGRPINWDGAKEQAVNDPEANKLVVGTYRSNWAPKGL